MAGFLEVSVEFPVLRGLRENDLIEVAEAIIEAGLLDAIDRIVARWYSFVNRRTGESGARSNWNLAKVGVMSFVIQNLAVTRASSTGRGGGRKYAGFVHPSGQTTPLVNTLVRREITKARKEITSNLLGLRATGVAPEGSLRPTEVSLADVTLDLLLQAFGQALPGNLLAAK